MSKYLPLLFVIFVAAMIQYAAPKIWPPKPLTAAKLAKKEVRDTLFKQLKHFGLAFNGYRKQKGVIVLPDSFELGVCGPGFVYWNNPNGEYYKPAYLYKFSLWKADTILFDRSYFIGPENERLEFMYYRNDSTGVYISNVGWSDAQGLRSFDLSLAQGDSVLRVWNLPYWK